MASSKGALVDATGAAPHFTLRTLCRALRVAAGNPAGNFKRSLYEAFSLSFLTQLDRNSHPIVEDLIIEHLVVPKKITDPAAFKSLKKKLKQTVLAKVLPHPDNVRDTVDGDDVSSVPDGTVIGKWVQVSGYWIPLGTRELTINDQYILTMSVQCNLRNVARVVSLGEGSPVLLQGDTSVGKTSLVTYLARKCGVPCIRINNHEHTDIQEYLGCYSPDVSGKLVFREGALVTAMRSGHWIILDELNLAPTDVLEALNRLLDDNRELYLPETQETVRAHPNFRLFATQNPPGLYGGRKVLSRAFRNRFVELHFDDIPGDELIEIIHKRCCLSTQHSKKLVAVLQGLQMRRGRENLFQGRQSLVTLRDLFRWAERYRLADKPDNAGQFYDWEQHLADEGYLVLAGRVRIEEEAQIIRDVIEAELRCKIDPDRLFNLTKDTSPVTRTILEKLEQVSGFEHLVFTDDMRRLYVLLAKSLSFGEPVLLVGETGCGKTTVCQMIAAQSNQELHIVNCHMHTEGADFLGGLRPVRNRTESQDDQRLFEWVDGPLIHAMKGGGMFLADEISLADDSVLERLNSVLEPERTLVLAEKGSDSVGKLLKTEVVVAHQHFRLIGTMNPGGDYGKKELSPAMRNRFTEIWCPKIEIERKSSDVLNIVEHNVRHGLVLGDSVTGQSGVGSAMLEFFKLFTRAELGKKCTISIRDLMSWVQFINKVTSEEEGSMDLGLAYIHGACLVLLDGLGSGLTGTGLDGWKELRDVSMNFLYQQVWQLTATRPNRSTLEEEYIKGLRFVDEADRFGVDPFLIEKGKEGVLPDHQFTFVAPRTCINLVRVLRGLQLNRPLLLEGSPGVGKTSLVVALAKASNNDIVRINLSEQTDVSDLFGADLPIEGASGGQFAWRDGPLLQALRNGSWVVLDELNLASQSVLEGLNACFDHRGEVFVPELDQTFKVSHKATKIFACQNPQHQGGARKGLPRSFLNRFTQVHVEPLASGDLEFILMNVFGGRISSTTVKLMVEFNRRLVEAGERGEWGLVGGPWELNLRDLFRWCELTLRYSPPKHRLFVDLLYAARMRTPADRDQVHAVFGEVFAAHPDQVAPLEEAVLQLTQARVQIGDVTLNRLQYGQQCGPPPRTLSFLPCQLASLRHVSACVAEGWLVLLIGGAAAGKTSVVQQVASMAGRRLHVVALTPQMDVGELLGGFEQVDHGRRLGILVEAAGELVTSAVKQALLANKTFPAAHQGLQPPMRLLKEWGRLLDTRKTQNRSERSISEETRDFLHQCDLLQKLLCRTASASYSLSADNAGTTDTSQQEACLSLEREVQGLKRKVEDAGGLASGGIFEWVDSPLVEAIRSGRWLLVEGASLCAASVLDRLNPLLEPGGRLLMAERGVIGGSVPCITPHPDFRMFLAIDHTRGEVSRAMRNRGVEIFLPPLLHSHTPTPTAPQSPKNKSGGDTSDDSGHSTDASSDEDDIYVTTAVLAEESGCGADTSKVTPCVASESGDWTALLVAQGVLCPKMQNALAHVHRLVTEALPAYLQPGLPVLLQAAQLSVQLRYSGEEDMRALALACQQGYVRYHGTVDLQRQVQQVLDEALRDVQEDKVFKTLEESWPSLGSLVLQTRALQQHGAAVVNVLQTAAYLKCLLISSNNTNNLVQPWTEAPLPPMDRFPKLEPAQAEVLAMILCTVPMQHWPLLQQSCHVLLKSLKGGKDVVATVNRLHTERKKGRLSDGGMERLVAVKGTEILTDPRFNVSPVMCSEGATREQVSCAANRVYLGIWRTLVLLAEGTKNAPIVANLPSSKKTVDGHSLLELSMAIHEKKLNKNTALHPSVPFLYSLFEHLDKFIEKLTSSTDVCLSLDDKDGRKMELALRWRDRLHELCSEPVARSSFHLFLPKLVLHWQFLQSNLFFKDEIPHSWSSACQGVVDKLLKTIQKLTKAFSSNCGPIHAFAEELCQQMEQPRPFPTVQAAEVQVLLLKLGSALSPDLYQQSRNIFLASEGCANVKAQLVMIATEFHMRKTKASKLLIRLKELEVFIESASKEATEHSSDLQQRKLSLLKVQSWPIIDHIASSLVIWTCSERAVPHSEAVNEMLQELVSLSVSMPLDVLESSEGSKSWVAALLSRVLSNTTASRNPHDWSTYPDVLNTDGDNDSVKKIVSRVHSPVQCLLTHLLSSGSADEALQELKVGIHSEKSEQLCGIRATLWKNWPALADPNLSPKVMFFKSVSCFSEELVESLSKAVGLSESSSSSLEERLASLFTPVREKCLPKNEVVVLLDTIQENMSSLAEPLATNLAKVSVLGTAVGTLQGWLTGHLEAMDPAQKRKLLLRYKNGDIDRLNQEILQHSWINILKGGLPISCENPSDSTSSRVSNEHPHLALRREELSQATLDVASLKQEVAFRPDESEYVRMTQDIAHFVMTAFNPPVMQGLISSLLEDDVTFKMTEQIDRKLITLDNFFNHIHSQYSLYRDITAPFLGGLVMATRSLRVLNAQTKMSLTSATCHRDLTQLLSQLASFPVRRDPLKPLEYLPHVKDDVESVVELVASSSTDGHSRVTKKCQSLALRTVLLELYTAVCVTGRLDANAAWVLRNVVTSALNWWRKQEEEKKKKEEEEASLYRYKAREHAKNETEEETIAREFAESFPSYDKDFDDLQDFTLEQIPENEESDVEEDAVDDWLTEPQMWEISEVHCDLLAKLPNTSMQQQVSDTDAVKTNPVKKFGPVPAALQRLKIVQTVMTVCGPMAGCDLDRSVMGAQLVFNDTACKSLHDPQSTAILEKPANFYVDPRPIEATKLRPLLIPLLKRIDELLVQWPEHPTLLLITRVAERVLEYPVTSPLAKLLAGLESILLKSEIWEANAHRGVSLLIYLTAVKTQVVAWRKTELQEWKHCLDLVTHNEAVASKMKWWPHLYDCLARDEWDSEAISALGGILKDLMESSTLGDYESKLTLINAFYHQLRISEKTECVAVINLTCNIHRYYSQFLPIIRSVLAKERKDIETKVKETVKVANYSIATFRDINQVREKVNKCCQALHSQMRRWKKFLMTQDKEMWAKDSADELKNPDGIWDVKSSSATSFATPVVPPAVLAVENISNVDEDSVLRSLKGYTNKAHAFVQQTLEGFPYSDCVECIEEVTSSIITAYQKLSTDAALAAGETDEVLRKKKQKSIVNMRRSNITRLFQQLNAMGVKYHRGNTLWTDSQLMKCYLVPALSVEELLLDERTLAGLRDLWPGCDKYFYRSINRFKLVHDKLASPHQDVGPELIKRIRGVTKHLMLLSVDVRKQLTLLGENLHLLRRLVVDIDSASAQPLASASSLKEIWNKINAFSLSLALTAAEVQAVLNTRPEGPGMVPDNDFSKMADATKLTETQRLLEYCEELCTRVARSSGQMVATFSEASWPRVVCQTHIELVGQLNDQLKLVSVTVSKVVSYVDPQRTGHMCLTRELIAWQDKWTQATRDIDQWLHQTPSPVMQVDTHDDLSEQQQQDMENCVSSVLYAVQSLYKKYRVESTNAGEEENCKPIISEATVESLLSDIKSLKLNYVLKSVKNLVSDVSEGKNDYLQHSLCQISSLLMQYASLGDNLLLSAAAGSRSLGKLLSVLLAVFYQMVNNGFCKPQEVKEEQGGEGKLSFDDDDSEAAGLADGEGKKDMSDKLESEDQLESALKDGEKEKPGDKDVEEEDGGVEMSNDFEGKLQDKDKPDPDDEKEEEDQDDEKNADDQMGETEQGAETLDKKLWNDKDGEENEQEDLEEDEDAQGNDDEMESQVVAKDKGKKESNKKEDKKDKDEEDAQDKADKPAEMDEDRRQPNKPTEDENYDDEFTDQHAGEENQKKEDDKQDEALEIPDNLNLDEAEEEREEEKEGGDDEEEKGPDPFDIEKKGLFPEGKDIENEEGKEDENKNDEDLPEEENPEKEDNEEDKENNMDEMEGTDKDFQAEVVKDEDENNESKEKEYKKNAGIDEGDNKDDEPKEEEDEDEKKDEDIDASKDKDTNTGAEAAPVDAKDASKDKTKEAPQTDDSGRQMDEEERQEESGEAREQTRETVGVGQSKAPPPKEEEMHKGEESAVTRQTESSSSQQQDVKQQKKPGEVDEQKVTGNPQKDVKQGLMTNKKNNQEKKNEDQDMEDNNDNEDAADKDSSLWQVIRKAEAHSDAQVVDAGTREQAVEAPAPVQDDDAEKPEEEGVQQTLMEVDEPEEAPLERTPEQEAEQIPNAGREHRQGLTGVEREGAVEEQERIETEGEAVLEHTVQRPPETYFHTLLEHEELTTEAQFDEDVAATNARLQATTMGLQRPDQAACVAWAQHQAQAAPYAAQLCDQLRLILEPTEAARLRGDYKTGKRLNMRKVIGYIASHFLKDKIWLRRTQPSKRTYHVLLAVDDSQSMQSVQAEELAKQSITLVATALTKLEVGKVGVLSFGSSTSVLHPLDEPFSDASGARVFANLRFDQPESRFVDLLESSVALLRQARGGAMAHSNTAQILIIISDGQTHARSEHVRAAVRAARNDRVFVVFFVLDASSKHSFYDLKVWDDATLTLQPMAEQFPFPFYLVVREVSTLPHVLADALRRWFELVTADATQ